MRPTMMNKAACDLIMGSLDIERVAEFYGLSVDRFHKTRCIFHDDKRPSMHFKKNRFRCFACGANGSAIDLVAKLFSVHTAEAIEKLNQDFGLGMDLRSSRIADSEIIKKRREREEEKKRKEEIERNAFNHYIGKKERLNALLRSISPDGRMEALYFETVAELTYIEYVLDILVGWSDEEKEEVYDYFIGGTRHADKPDK